MRILSSKDASLIDRHTMRDLEVPGEILMGQAGLALAKKAKEMLITQGGNRVAILCGRGNNGGDGYATAVRLMRFGVDISLFSIVPIEKISGDAKIFYNRCVEQGLKVVFQEQPDEVDLSNFDLIIDGLLGTGIQGQVRPNAAIWIQKINSSGVPVLAIDIPSGVSADSGQILGEAVKAGDTVTMGFLKQGLVMNPGAELAGNLEVADLGYPDKAFDILEQRKLMFDEQLARSFLTRPPSNTYKHQQGKVLVLGGSKGYTGAACLASNGALRSGAGLVIAGVPESLNQIFESKLTEIITAPVPDDGLGHFISQSLDTLKSQFEWCHVVAIGPGLGTKDESLEFVKSFFTRCNKPMVIDADALRVFHGNLDMCRSLSGEFILTPHYGEAAALFSVEKNIIVNDPFQFILESAKRVGGIIVLKGAPTLVSNGESVVANTSGHQGLATGGSGDVLTGIIASFLAQGLPAYEAAQLGVFIHGRAADQLLQSHGYRGLIAGDLLSTLPSVISEYEQA